MLITEYYRNLPHWQPVGACFFVTFNLRGTIPRDVYERLQEEKQLALARISKNGGDAVQLYAEHKRHFARVDHILDTCQHGPDYLKHTGIAEVVKTKLHQYDNQNYDLLAYCVMSNHVHLVVDSAVQLDKLAGDALITSQNYTQLHATLKHIKGGSARSANGLLKRTGAFWQPESYDHYIRDASELRRVVDYVLQIVRSGKSRVGRKLDGLASQLSEIDSQRLPPTELCYSGCCNARPFFTRGRVLCYSDVRFTTTLS